MNDSEIYECEHRDKIIRKIQPEYIIKVCNRCYEEFSDVKTRPLFLAKQILSLCNKMIEKTPEFNDKQNLDKSIKSWYECNTDVLEQLKKLNMTEEDKTKNTNTTKDETSYDFDQILHETEINVSDGEQNSEGKNLHDLYRHSTKLIK